MRTQQARHPSTSITHILDEPACLYPLSLCDPRRLKHSTPDPTRYDGEPSCRPTASNPKPQSHNPDPREDLESRSPNLGPYTTKGTVWEPPLRDLLFGSFPGVWETNTQLGLVIAPHCNQGSCGCHDLVTFVLLYRLLCPDFTVPFSVLLRALDGDVIAPKTQILQASKQA